MSCACRERPRRARQRHGGPGERRGRVADGWWFGRWDAVLAPPFRARAWCLWGLWGPRPARVWRPRRRRSLACGSSRRSPRRRFFSKSRQCSDCSCHRLPRLATNQVSGYQGAWCDRLASVGVCLWWLVSLAENPQHALGVHALRRIAQLVGYLSDLRVVLVAVEHRVGD